MKDELKRRRAAHDREVGEALRRFMSAEPVELPREALEQGNSMFRRMAPKRGPVFRIVARPGKKGLEILNTTGAEIRWPGALPEKFVSGDAQLHCVLSQSFPALQIFAALGAPAAGSKKILFHLMLHDLDSCASMLGTRVTLYHNGRLLGSHICDARGNVPFTLPGRGVYHALIGTGEGIEISLFVGV